MYIQLQVIVKPKNGLPCMMLSASKEGKTIDVPFDSSMSLQELFGKFDGIVQENKYVASGDSDVDKIFEGPIEKTNKEMAELKPEDLAEFSKPFKDNSQIIQREDLIQVTNIIPGLKDAGGNELIDRGIVQGGIYRVAKINQQGLVIPDKPDEITFVVQSYEVIDDKSAIPRRLSVFPSEVQLHKKRTKDKSIKTGKVSEFLKCQNCEKENALVLDGNQYIGKCLDCGADNKIERKIEKCSNEKCLDANGNRSVVALYKYGDEFSGKCGTCGWVTKK